MTTFESYAANVEQMETGQLTRSEADLTTAIQTMIESIRAESWEDGDERGLAQVLVYRLERLLQKRPDDTAPAARGESAGNSSASVPSPAHTTKSRRPPHKSRST